MTNEHWEERRRDERAATDADQAEAHALSYGSATVDAGLHDERISGSIDQIEVAEADEQADWARSDAATEEGVTQLARELHRRKQLLNGFYPFELDGPVLRYRQTSTLVYELCLAISLMPTKRGRDFLLLSRAFERLICQILRCFLGPGTQSYRTGYSGYDEEDRPSRFRDVAQAIHDSVGTGEWTWAPATGFSEDPNPAQVKDLGIDAVAWKVFGDRRMGNLFFLGNCACGDDWESKLGTIQVADLRDNWFRPLSKPDPTRVFATPHHIPNNPHFQSVNSKAGLTLDRTRVTLVAEVDSNPEAIIADRQENYEELIRLSIRDFRAE